jgi:TctA family transporter
MKSKGTAFFLCLFGFIGLAGFQHFYMGKIFKGLIWLFTAGIFGLGTLIDLFTIGGQVDNHNTKLELKTIRAHALAGNQNQTIIHNNNDNNNNQVMTAR